MAFVTKQVAAENQCEKAKAFEYSVGDPIARVGSDYRFDGEVTAVFHKKSGQVRYAVEDDRGVIHIMHANQMQHRPVEGSKL